MHTDVYLYAGEKIKLTNDVADGPFDQGMEKYPEQEAQHRNFHLHLLTFQVQNQSKL